ncbi:inosine monophosphate dehydrogenase [Venturia nashicola]|uniref:Inosine monophosphate dehydrogenase n=1 Tax=Venturia nashicola TaxID=86259 RepID=A0A4Z1P1S8_9PEZI|nr:inosine monophosphate dehydrogenase [Venturia nashicola]TLD21821.1 inosine monophosphate dehydrogenase [Venturia nashicola]
MRVLSAPSLAVEVSKAAGLGFIGPGTKPEDLGDVVEAQDGGQNTIRAQYYNHLRGTMDWPEAFDARGIVNQRWRDFETGLPFEQAK